MTPRAIRRAAQRHADKLARKAARQSVFNAEIQHEDEEAVPQTHGPAMDMVAAANASLSAVTSNLTGHATLLPTADAAQYEQLLHDYQTEFQPIGLQESNLVQTLAESDWRSRRIVALEMGIFAKGRIEFAQQFAEHNPEIRISLIEVHTFLTYEKQIRALQLQEARLSRRADNARAELRALQTERKQREQAARQAQLEAAAQLYQAAQQTKQPFHPEENGFEFSNHEIESYLARKQAIKNKMAASYGSPIHAEAA
jgi:hypothetical protein